MAYATTSDVQSRLSRTLSETELAVCGNLLEDASLIIDTFNADADSDAKKVVSVRMVTRAIGDGESYFPLGTTQGSMSGLGYSQSFTVGSGGGVGELYLTRLEKQLLGLGNNIGSHSPVEDSADCCEATFYPPGWWSDE